MNEISVIVPMYNSENFIKNILLDLESQIFKNFEIIIIDDGSKDNSVKMTEEFKKHSSMKLKIITLTHNGGTARARNIGLKEAKCKYVYFVDSDDRITNDCLLNLYKDITETDSDIAICNYDVIDENQQVIFNENRIFIFNDNFPSSLDNKIVFQSKLVLERPENSNGSFLTGFAPMGCFLFKKDIVEINKIKFTSGARYGEDTEFFAKIIFYSKNIVLDKRILSHHVYNKSSQTRRHSNPQNILNMVFNYVGSFQRLAKYLEKQNAPKSLVNYIYYVVIPDVVVSNAIRRLMIEDYPKDKLKTILKNKQIQRMIKRYKFSFRNKFSIKRSIRVLSFILSPTLFYIFFTRRLKLTKRGI